MSDGLKVTNCTLFEFCWRRSVLDLGTRGKMLVVCVVLWVPILLKQVRAIRPVGLQLCTLLRLS